MIAPGDDATNFETTGCELLFVCGTLLRGSSHHHILKSLRSRYLGRGIVQAELFDLGRFPGALLVKPMSPGIGSRRVMGELYRLQNPERDLNVLDRYEGIQPATPEMFLFRRQLTHVWMRDRNTVQAWIYCLDRRPAVARLIPSGDYGKATRR